MYNWGGALQTYLPYMRVADIYLMYAEAGAAAGGPSYKSSKCSETAVDAINVLRDRVGAGHVADKYLTDKNKFMDEARRERACELGMTNNRYYDMIRYKRTDWMTKRLHGLITFRMMQNSKREWVRSIRPYIGDDKNNRVEEPYCFTYQKFEIQNRASYLWDHNPNDPEVKKWLLMPMPLSEINKNYGLVQNPGW
jgi:hypothetical protein